MGFGNGRTGQALAPRIRIRPQPADLKVAARHERKACPSRCHDQAMHRPPVTPQRDFRKLATSEQSSMIEQPPCEVFRPAHPARRETVRRGAPHPYLDMGRQVRRNRGLARGTPIEMDDHAATPGGSAAGNGTRRRQMRRNSPLAFHPLRIASTPRSAWGFAKIATIVSTMIFRSVATLPRSA